MGRLAKELTSLVASAPQGPVAQSLQRALLFLNQGSTLQNEVTFDDRLQLAEIPSALQQAAGQAAQVAADQPDLDVSPQAQEAATYLESAQNDFGQLSGIASTATRAQREVSKYYAPALTRVDRAISQLKPT